ncbi:MAG: hypothetical protein M1823_003603 [Watsoniomyces obsoletus]|nr:MAG: hypothetical protein M1823_003603 [Watsoniomyces obsoletus]
MSDSYLPGVQVLAHSLRDAGTRKKLAVLVTMDTISAETMTELNKLYDYIIPVERIINRSPAKLFLMDRWDLKSTFTKIGLWHQTQFRKIVYLDADVVALRAPDELFDIKAPFAAAPDIGWPDCFNSGVLVLTPNMADYYSLLALAQRGVSFDGADQGLLNMHFKDYHRISFRYNCTPSGHYQYVPAYRHFEADISLLHFIGKDKPWSSEGQSSRVDSIYNELLGRWWAVHDRHLRVQEAQSGAEPVVEHIPVAQESQQRISEHQPQSPPEPSISEAEHHEKASAPQHSEPPPPAPAPFVAPQATWDPSKSAPPPDSQPEAPNFPQRVYEMSQDRELFQPPSSYPEPPKDLWYEVPQKPAAAPTEPRKPIFPWELNMPKATRVFVEDFVPSPSTTPLSPPILGSDEQTTPSADLMSPTTTSTAQVAASPDPWSTYSVTNAWDEIPEIEEYISHIVHRRKASAQIIHGTSSTSETQAEDAEEDVLSPGTGGGTGRGKRRPHPSLKLTDFPTEFERPSLPVTPAPVRGGSSFWGTDRTASGGDDDTDSSPLFPPAEGVPKQEDWDPVQKLKELTKRQTSALVAVVGDEEAVKPIKEATMRSTILGEDEEEEEEEEEDEDEATPILERGGEAGALESEELSQSQSQLEADEEEEEEEEVEAEKREEEPSVTMPKSLSSSVDITLLEEANTTSSGEMEGGMEPERPHGASNAQQTSFVSTAV